MSDDTPARLGSLAGLQAGIITRRQALTAGMAPGAIEWKLHAGRWKQVHWGVYGQWRDAEL